MSSIRRTCRRDSSIGGTWSRRCASECCIFRRGQHRNPPTHKAMHGDRTAYCYCGANCGYRGPGRGVPRRVAAVRTPLFLPELAGNGRTRRCRRTDRETDICTHMCLTNSLTRLSIRHSSCDSPAVACRHSEIVLNGGDWLLQPISANRTVHNPTFLNGQPVVGSCKLAPGDTITLGAPLRALPADPVPAHAEALPEDSHAQARQPTRLADARLSQRRMSADASSLV